MRMNTRLEQCRRQLFMMIDIGSADDLANRSYDILYTAATLINLLVSILYTFQEIRNLHGELLLWVEAITIGFFAFDYGLRLLTAKYLYPQLAGGRAIWKYAISFTGIVDILSFLPYYLPVFFPAGAVAFRMFRIIRIFRLFRVSAYHDSLNVITEVISSKRQQLLSSVFIILILMLASSLCMYSIEHDAQPEVFTNAFSGIWWSVSTLLTIGYGDIYPITTIGKIFSIFITFLGVGMVAIPTGIISAGFVDQYSRIKRISEYAQEEEINFIKVHLVKRDRWVGQPIQDIGLPTGVIIAAIRRGKEIIVPRGGVVLQNDDILILGAESYGDDRHVDLKEIILRKHHPWNGQAIRDLDISRQTLIVLVERKKRMLIPRGDLVLQENDKIILYTQTRMSDATTIQI